MKQENLILYTKKVRLDNKKTFDKFLCKVGKAVYDCNLTKECQVKLNKEMSNNSLTFPLELGVSLEHDDYFITIERFERSDNSKGEKYVVVLRDYQSVVQSQFTQKLSLDDLYK